MGPVFRRDKEELIAAMNRKVDKLPGALWNFSQPIEDNVGETITGTKGQLALKLFGKDLKTLDETGDEVTAAMAHVPGLMDLKFFHTLGQPNLNFTLDRRLAARLGLTWPTYRTRFRPRWAAAPSARCSWARSDTTLWCDTRRPIATRRRPSPMSVCSPPPGNEFRSHGLHQNGSERRRLRIYREGNSRYAAITFSVRGRDLGSTVADAMEQVRQKVKLPQGYHLEWSGEYESEKRAAARLMIIVRLPFW